MVYTEYLIESKICYVTTMKIQYLILLETIK